MTRGHLVIDLGGVLFHFDHAHRLDRLAAACGLGARQVHEMLWLSGFNAECDRGLHGSAARIRDQIRATLSFPGSDTDLDDAWCSAYRPNQAVVEALDRRRDGRSLALFTNNGPLEEETLTRRHPEIFARFERLFFSYRLRCCKPDPAAFAAVAGELGTQGKEIMFIDDSPANVAAALEAGWDARSALPT